MTPTQSRIVTAGMLLLVFVPAVLWAPAWLWAALMAVVVGMAAHEWAQLSQFPPASARLYAALIAACSVALPLVAGETWPVYRNALILLSMAFWLGLALVWLQRRWRAEHAFVRAAVGGVLLLPTWAALLYLHARGPGVLLGVLALVWIADTAAYFSGRRFGHHKLAPSISPGKTIEGVAGAMVALTLYAVILSTSVPLPLLPLLVAVAVLLYLAVLGDLFESWIKRVAGMKDSGNLLPGHGGVLDRIDALTSTLPVVTGMLIWMEYTV